MDGVPPQTEFRWFREGTLPVATVRVNQRTVLVDPGGGDAPTGGVGLCARVSSRDQRVDFDRQVARLSQLAAQVNMPVVRVEAEIGSGMDGARRKVRRLLADPKVSSVAVEHRDRWGAMNTELVEAALAAHGRRLVVLDDGEVTDDLVRGRGGGVDLVLSPALRASLGPQPGDQGDGLRAARCRAAAFVGAHGQDGGHEPTAGTAPDR